MGDFQVEIFRVGLIAILSGIGIILLGLLWSPVGERICRWLARRNDNEWANAIRQRGYYSSRHLPVWLYLVFLAIGKPLPSKVVAIGYVSASVLWLMGPVGFWANMVLFLLFFNDGSTNEDLGITFLVAFVTGGVVCFNSWLLYQSWQKLFIAQRRRRQLNLSGPAIPVPEGYVELFRASNWAFLSAPLVYLLGLGLAILSW